MGPLVSVVIPIYNVEKWIPNCIGFLLNQSYSNLEIILVNDGSEDNSAEVSERYALLDNRIQVYHKTNGGVSSARNKGIEIAKGKYIVFIDPDDEIDRSYIIEFLLIAEKLDSDVLISGYKTVPNNIGYKPGFVPFSLMSGRELILSSKNLHTKNDLAFAWRYFYKTSVIKNNMIMFNQDVSIGEDVIFNLEVLLASTRVYATDLQLYSYTINNSQSVMRQPYKNTLEKSLIEQYKVKKKLSIDSGLIKDDSYRKDMANYYLNSMLKLMISNVYKGERQNYFKALKRILNYEMIVDSTKILGLFYNCRILREYLYYLAIKFKIYSLIYVYHNRINS
ncbi:glycosyltransferase [Robertmurraya sp. GLU-23]